MQEGVEKNKIRESNRVVEIKEEKKSSWADEEAGKCGWLGNIAETLHSYILQYYIVLQLWRFN